jgi:hypothetical protein
VYRKTLLNVAGERPDFHIDLGDTFMAGKLGSGPAAAKQYIVQRYYLGLVGANAPIFLALGNHDGEEAGRRGGSDLAEWSCLKRQAYFPNPLPDSFYSGSDAVVPGVGRLQDYYAWEWGDALFVVLDPYWYSAGSRGGREPWNMTLGSDQYRWLVRTLEGSCARFRFVFIHQLVGGIGSAGRGGAEAATLLEWGGRDSDGTGSFSSHRPGWKEPIHDLLVRSRVTVVFHGHAHFYARQELDGIVYQLVPQPGNPAARRHHAEEYGYRSGLFLTGSGHLRVRVAPTQVTVDYIRSDAPGISGLDGADSQAAHSYTCPAGRTLPVTPP